jgi:adenosylmethionine-8-amino-7-oxononanoate aminotransferase
MEHEAEKDNVFYRILKKEFWPVIDRGEGIYLYDTNGNKYIDGCSGSVVVNIGHGVQEVAEAMYRQAKKVCFARPFVFANEPQIALAERIIELSPKGMSRVFFSSGGAEAVETAIKLARQYHVETGNAHKFIVISRWHSYHGNTIGALSATGRISSRKYFTPYLLNFPHIQPSYCYRCPFGKTYPGCGIDCAYALEEEVKYQGPENVSAFIGDPIPGSMIEAATPPPEYWPIIRSICDKYNILLIDDEVLNGFGRTGRNFGIDHWNVIPDIMTLGKGVSSGYAPISATVVQEKVFNVLRNGSGNFKHGYTMGGNLLSCSAGLANVEYMIKNNLIHRAAKRGDYFFKKASTLKKLEMVGDIRGKGLLIGIEFVKDKELIEPFEVEREVNGLVTRTLFKNGLMVMPGTPETRYIRGDGILLAPPLVIDEPQLDDMIAILERSIIEVQELLKS